MNKSLEDFFNEFEKTGHGNANARNISVPEITSADELERFAAACFELRIYDKAAEAAEKAVLLAPSAKLHFLCGVINGAAGKTAASIASYEKSLAFDPSFVPALVNMGEIISKAGKLGPAADLIRKALEKNPDDGNANLIMGNILVSSGDSKEAISYYEKAAASSGNGISPLSNILVAMQYRDDMTGQEVAEEHFRTGRLIEERAGSIICPKGKVPDSGGRKIRIGYLSHDFRRHSVAYFIEPVIYCHDRGSFDIFCYYDNPSSDETTARLKTFPVTWRDTAALSDSALAAQIRSDSIDILVDLAGHTGRRLLMLASRPAPVIASWIGYPSTTGISSIDYFISDLVADPSGNESLYSERLLRIDPCNICFAPPSEAPDISSAPLLANKSVTFGCMNNLSKISRSVFGAWTRILLSVPGSMLLLKSKAIGDKGVSDKFRKIFTDSGIAAERIILHGYESELSNHLEFYNKIDIALDTFPCNGVTTTCEALWMGVPVITLSGDRCFGRMGASILNALKLNGFIAKSHDEYVAKAVSLASSQDFLAGLRNAIRPLMASSPLCDAVRFTALLEEQYGKILRG